MPLSLETRTSLNKVTIDNKNGLETLRHSNLKTKKKYTPVAQKVRVILGEMPEKFRII